MWSGGLNKVSLSVLPKNSIIKQYKKMFKIDGVELDFEQEAVDLIVSNTKTSLDDVKTLQDEFKDYKTSLRDNELTITVDTDEDITLEKGLLKERANFFEEVFFLKPVIMQQKGR